MSNAGRVLVVEDQEVERRALSQILKQEGLTVFGAESADKALGYVDENIDVVLSDLHMGDVSGIDLLQLWKKRQPDTQFIVMTGHDSSKVAVEAMKGGAFDYVTKPVNPIEIVLLIKRAIAMQQQSEEIDSLRRRLDERFGVNNIVGQSKQMRDVYAKIQRAAPVDSTVLILGESGTGKELVAQGLHHNSNRKKGPFVAVNCAAVPATLVESELFGHVRGAFTGATDRRMGRFEQADGGTLFIDEVGDFELALQAKLLRVLETYTVTPVGGHEDRKVNVRVVAATSRDITKMVKEGTFREDLFYRLNVIQVVLPPLRDRREDIPALAGHFLARAAGKLGRRLRLAPPTLERLLRYPWPGNVRELENAIERAAILARTESVEPDDLPPHVSAGLQLGPSPALPRPSTLADAERAHILQTVERFGRNHSGAAEALGIGRTTLWRKLKEYGIER